MTKSHFKVRSQHKQQIKEKSNRSPSKAPESTHERLSLFILATDTLKQEAVRGQRSCTRITITEAGTTNIWGINPHGPWFSGT